MAGTKPNESEPTPVPGAAPAGASGNGASAPSALVVPDAADIEALWLDLRLGDGIVTNTYHSVAVGKPRDFFRTVVDPAYRRRTEIYVHKPEGIIEEVSYIIAPSMRGLITEANPCTIVTVVDRNGTPRLWPIKFPKDGERDNDAGPRALGSEIRDRPGRLSPARARRGGDLGLPPTHHAISAVRCRGFVWYFRSCAARTSLRWRSTFIAFARSTAAAL